MKLGTSACRPVGKNRYRATCSGLASARAAASAAGEHAPSAASNCASLLVTSVPVNPCISMYSSKFAPSSCPCASGMSRTAPSSTSASRIAQSSADIARTPGNCGKKPPDACHIAGTSAATSPRVPGAVIAPNARKRSSAWTKPATWIHPPSRRRFSRENPGPMRTLHHSWTMSRPSNNTSRDGGGSVGAFASPFADDDGASRLRSPRRRIARTRGRAAPDAGDDDGAFSRTTEPSSLAPPSVSLAAPREAAPGGAPSLNPSRNSSSAGHQPREDAALRWREPASRNSDPRVPSWGEMVSSSAAARRPFRASAVSVAGVSSSSVRS